MKPPTASAVTVLLGTGVSAPIAINVGNASDRELSIIATNAFDILFSDDGTSNIPIGMVGSVISSHQLGVRTLYTFQLGPKNTHFRLGVSTSVSFKYWLSSRT